MVIVSSPNVGRSLPKQSGLLWEALVCEKHIPKPAPNGIKIYHDMLMPLHDSMPSFMNFRRVLDLLEFKARNLNVCGRDTVAGCLTFIPISCMGPKHATKDTYLNCKLIYMH